MAIQIGKYKRPGIFIEEFDNSVIASPTTTGVTTFVMGFSKKGPVNTPVLLQNTTDLQNIFGNIDTNLERKGSYFHRTVAQMLQSSPVYAINLLSTSDILDTIEYKSVSTATDKNNDITRDGAYRRFFDTTGFWKKDTESFINITKTDLGHADRLLSFTNMSDKYITVFVYKSKLKGFDQTLLTWYGSADLVPAYLNQLDYASDYLVDVIVVSGDWSNYQQLAVDANWSKYFTSQGLKKDQVYNFANDRNVNLLKFYEGLSLIPYFRDSNGKNIFIETNINQDTNLTGLFCAFDADKLEGNYPNGMVDLIGNNLVNSDSLVDNGQTSIDFLSYQGTIIESLTYQSVPLDVAGGSNGQNVFAILATSSRSFGLNGDYLHITAYYSEGYISCVHYATSSASLSGTSSLTIVYSIDPSVPVLRLGTSSAYFVSGGNKVLVNGGTYSPSETFTITSPTANVSSFQEYTSVVHLDSNTGNILLTNGTIANQPPVIPTSDLVLSVVNYWTYKGQIVQNFNVILNNYSQTNTGLTFSVGTGSTYFPLTNQTISGTPSNNILTLSASASNYVFVDNIGTSGTLGVSTSSTFTSNQVLLYTVVTGATHASSVTQNSGITSSYKPSVTPIGLTANGFYEFDFGGDYTVTEVSPGTIKIEFLQTADFDVVTNYDMHRRIRSFNFLLNMLDSTNINKMTMIKDITSGEKLSLANASVVSTSVSSTSNKSITLNLGIDTTPSGLTAGNLVFYALDNEFILGTTGLETRSTTATASTGIVAQYSNFYSNFYNGQINTGDYFYKNLIKQSTPVRVVLQNVGTSSYFVTNITNSYWSSTNLILGNEQILIPDSTLNTGLITLNGSKSAQSLVDPATGVTYSNGYYAFKVTSNLTTEDLTVTQIHDATTKIYLQMYLDSSNNLKVKFVADDLTSTESIEVDIDNQFEVISDKSDYKQSIDIVEPAGYTPVINKILVEASRYPEVKVGNFLEAYVDPTITLGTNEVPRKLTRITSKRVYSNNTSLAEITCDSAIEKYEIMGATSSSYQTMRYTTMDDYITTYQAIPLKGFRVRQASMPDGTEDRQSSILNLVAKGTPLFKAITNKEAIDIRYVVDAFGLGLIERSKQQLVDICGSRLDCLGFINMPSMKSFKNSTSPTFIDTDPTSKTYQTLLTEYIASGGNLSDNPAFLYSFGDGQGASCVGYFLPYVTVNDNGRPTEVPPAMYVATTYMRKQNTNVTSIVPWTIAAGVTNGRITNIAGLEMSFTPTDIENFNGAQMNPIVYKRNRGFVIETENTGQTLYKSALSYLHVREVLIELERELSAMLLDFQWRFNTSEVRAEIKLRADVICEKYVNKNGLYNYFNKCDEENNTPTIIDNQIGVLDTYVEPIKGMGIIVNNITILRTGAISAGGFINQ